MPVLVDGDLVLSDSPLILEYLEERFPEPPLFPADEPRREELRIFLDWFNHVWKRPPNLIAAEEQKPDPDRERIAELEGGSRTRCRSSSRCSPAATTSSATS